MVVYSSPNGTVNGIIKVVKLRIFTTKEIKVNCTHTIQSIVWYLQLIIIYECVNYPVIATSQMSQFIQVFYPLIYKWILTVAYIVYFRSDSHCTHCTHCTKESAKHPSFYRQHIHIYNLIKRCCDVVSV